jgi:hypothetical protein
MGRPSIYSEEVVAEILRRISAGESLVSVCRDDHMPHRDTVYDWLDQNADFSDRYARARARQADAVAEMAVEEALQAEDPQMGRLAFDARKWWAAKVAPTKYGDRTVMSGDASAPISQEIRIITGVPRLEDDAPP